MNRFVIAALACCALAGCEDKKKEPALPPASSAPVASAKPVEEASEVSDDAIPTREDFEEEALQDITAENMEEELDKLEAEIGG